MSDTRPFRGTLVTDILSGRPCMRRVELVVAAGPDRGRTLEVGDLSVIVGTHPETDLVLADPLVSRQHLEVRLLDDGVEVRDLDSKNGTWVGGGRIERAVVAPGGRLRLGDTELSISAVDEPMDLGSGLSTFGALSTKSPRMREVYGLLGRVAKSDASILLEGETGVGKDVLARTIHGESHRSSGPFLVLDCGSVSRELLASELFGHKKGAFTGAMTDRVGLFESARGGTVFLDELGELASDLQPSLLRVLESRQVTRLGETQTREVDVRVIAATNRSLRDEVRAGRFREDLFFRLAVVAILIPPLRERREDLGDLARSFLEAFVKTDGRDLTLTDTDVAKLREGRWSGNVRELKNVIERSALLSGNSFRLQMPPASSGTFPAVVDPEPMGTGPGAEPAGVHVTADAFSDAAVELGDLISLPFKDAKQEALGRFEKAYLKARLDLAGGNVSKLATEVGLARAYVHRLLTRHGIDRTRKPS